MVTSDLDDSKQRTGGWGIGKKGAGLTDTFQGDLPFTSKVANATFHLHDSSDINTAHVDAVSRDSCAHTDILRKSIILFGSNDRNVCRLGCFHRHKRFPRACDFYIHPAAIIEYKYPSVRPLVEGNNHSDETNPFYGMI